MLDKNSIATLLDDIADLMEYLGENTFKIRAYRTGASVIRDTGEDVIELIKNNNLDKLKGIGKGLQGVIFEFFDLGESSLYAELKDKVPDGIESLLKLRGLGVKKIQLLYKELGINNIDELEKAVKEDKLLTVKGFGGATQNKILQEIKNFRENQNFILINKALKNSSLIFDILKSLNGVSKIEPTGNIRRLSEITDKIEFVALSPDKESLLSELTKTFKTEVENGQIIIRDYFEVPVILHVTNDETEFIHKLFITTGSDEFISKLNGNLETKNYKSEDEIFKHLKMNYVAPELREEQYFEFSPSPSDLDIKDFKGLLHFHTVYSDGHNSLDEMVKKGMSMGFEYFAVCDHSQSAIYANGLNKQRLLAQAEEITKVAAENNVTIFKGIESDILVDGSLDYEQEFLSHFNFIVASVHSRFSLNEEEMTKRIINAIENEYTDVLGHPTGRLLLRRPPFQVDIKKVIDAAFANSVAIEINANPWRLDLDWRYLYYALNKGCMISINADAHSTNDIELTKYGMFTGKKAGLQKKSVINCYDLKEFSKFLNRKIKKV